MFADSKAIANLTTSENSSFYTCVEAVSKVELADNDGYDAVEFAIKVGEEAVIVKNSNDALVTSLEKHLNTLLIALTQDIDAVTESENVELLKLRSSGVTGLSTLSEPLVDSLTASSTKIKSYQLQVCSKILIGL